MTGSTDKVNSRKKQTFCVQLFQMLQNTPEYFRLQERCFPKQFSFKKKYHVRLFQESDIIKPTISQQNSQCFVQCPSLHKHCHSQLSTTPPKALNIRGALTRRIVSMLPISRKLDFSHLGFMSVLLLLQT